MCVGTFHVTSFLPSASIPELKVILVGDSAVGKTSLITSYLRDEFESDTISTVALRPGRRRLHFLAARK
jgi:GTPase SAR1 family protein